jgi:phage terminase large subunit-like protein
MGQTDQPAAIDHVVSRYALDVIEGREVAGDLVQLACKRHLDDLENAGARGWVFDGRMASRVLNWARLLPHTQGPLAGKPLELQPWQKFRIGSLYGWRSSETGLRRFWHVYNQVGKKNGKTADTAVPLLWSQLFDNEGAPEAFCAATNSKQARLLFDGLTRIIQRQPFLRRVMVPSQHKITTPSRQGKITLVAGGGDSLDGVMPSFVARDEFHRWADRDLSNTLVESMSARAQPVDWVITTAGEDRASLCGELRDYCEQVLRGSVIDDRTFGYIAEPPQGCDPADPVAWAMANPNLDVSKPREAVAHALAKAQVITADMPAFRRFHLNLWTEGAESWIAQDSWGGGDMGARFDPASLYGRRAWVGLDLSNKVDLTAICVAVPDDAGVIWLLTYTFMPEGDKGFIRRAQAEKREYVAWRDQGWLEVHAGGVIDEQQLVTRMEWLRAKFRLQEVAFDPWGMGDLATELANRRFPMVEHRQGFQSMSNPMKRVEERVARRTLRHGGNPVLSWSVSNVARDEDAAENIKPNKRRSKGRIDPAVAMMMAVGRAEAGLRVRKRAEVG